MPEKSLWRIIRAAAEEAGCTDLVVVTEKRHLIVELSTPNGKRRRTRFSTSSSDMNFEHAVKRQLKRIAEDKE